ncbi:MAG: diadenylate cyclase CdaA [Clostridiales bacterium]|nr:diadenylate cyclase CdaA [Clostridiales bacterium]
MDIIETLKSIWEPVRAVFGTFRFTDFLDICLVAFVIYGAIKLVRDTRSIQLVKGFIILGIIYSIISLLNMQASIYLFSRLFSNIILVLIVLFQPEIRHAVEAMGRRRFKTIGGLMTRSEQLKINEKTNYCIGEVCKACAEMSDRKIGALIVFERETLLGEIIATGTKIDAEISEELVENIFFPKASLHDGALVIRENRAYAAGCILPLTKNHSGISSELGTRHRAAIGASELGDVFVVVVSEETGYISTALKGNLRRNISDGELREELIDLLIPKEIKSDSAFSRFKKVFEGRKEHEEKNQ